MDIPYSTKATMEKIKARNMSAIPSITPFRSGPRQTKSLNVWVLSDPIRYARGLPQEAGTPSSETLSVNSSRAAPSTKHAAAPSITSITLIIPTPQIATPVDIYRVARRNRPNLPLLFEGSSDLPSSIVGSSSNFDKLE